MNWRCRDVTRDKHMFTESLGDDGPGAVGYWPRHRHRPLPSHGQATLKPPQLPFCEKKGSAFAVLPDVPLPELSFVGPMLFEFEPET